MWFIFLNNLRDTYKTIRLQGLSLRVVLWSISKKLWFIFCIVLREMLLRRQRKIGYKIYHSGFTCKTHLLKKDANISLCVNKIKYISSYVVVTRYQDHYWLAVLLHSTVTKLLDTMYLRTEHNFSMTLLNRTGFWVKHALGARAWFKNKRTM